MTATDNKPDSPVGPAMHRWARDLFPICRSLTGPGVRETLEYIRTLIPGLVIHEVPSGTVAYDWTVPDEWFIRDAFIATESGERIVDFRNNNLHVVGYSEPVDRWMDFDELNRHLYSLPGQPDAIPYVTSYYQRRWGFCLSDAQRTALPPGRYHAFIDADLRPGVLNYGELILPGKRTSEVLLSTYICHPSMANNELSGIVVTTALAQWIAGLKKRKLTYRIIFIPETIGSIIYLSLHLDHLKKNVVAGFNVTCVGDDRSYSYLPSRAGGTLADKAAVHVLKHIDPDFKRYTWLDRGSDERQYCAPGVDLPVASIMRTKYGEYPEYHTSLDNLDIVVTPAGLTGGYNALRRGLEVIEKNTTLTTTVMCEPNLGKRGLYPTLSMKRQTSSARTMLDLMSYCDGTLSLLEISEILGMPFWDLVPLATQLIANGLVVDT